MDPTLWQALGILPPPWLLTAHAWGMWLTHHWWWLVITAAGAVALSVLVGLARRPRDEASEAYGSARFMTPREVQRSPAFHGSGVVVGQHRGALLQLDHEENVAVIGGKGKGKSAGPIIMSILHCPHSAVILDGSGELVTLTARARKRRGFVHIFDPRNPAGDHYNCLEAIRWGPYEEIDIGRVVDQLSHVEATVKRSDEGNYYRPWARSLLSALIAWVHDQQTYPCAVPGVLQCLAAQPFHELLAAMQQASRASVAQTATLLAGNRPDIIKGVCSTVLSWLLPWQGPLFAACSMDTTMPILDFQRGSIPHTLYLRVTVEDLQGPLQAPIRLMADQIGFRLCDRDPEAYDQELLWVFDDAKELGAFPLIPLTAEHRRKYGHRVLLACQSFWQLLGIFGPYTGGLLTWLRKGVLFEPQEPREGALIRAPLGETTIVGSVERLTRRGWGEASRSTGDQAHRRALMTPEEIMRLGRRVLVCISGQRPALLEQARWYDESA